MSDMFDSQRAMASAPMQAVNRIIDLLQSIDDRLKQMDRRIDEVGQAMGVNTGAITTELRAIREALPKLETP